MTDDERAYEIRNLLWEHAHPALRGMDRERIAEDKQRAEARLRNGADCPWTAAEGIPDLHCCKNGRLYRLHPLKPAGKYEPAFEGVEGPSVRDRTVRNVNTAGIRAISA